jgi:hypothetical protein
MKTTEKTKQGMKEYYKKHKEKRKKQMLEYWFKNKEKFQQYKKDYYLNNKEYIKNKNKLWRILNKETLKVYMKNYNKNRKKTDIQFWMRANLRDRVIKAFKQFSKTGKIKSADKYGIDYNAIIQKLIFELPKDFNPKIYHIDHIEALCSFNLEDPKEIKKAFAPENHQWLRWEDNLKKISKDIQLKKIKQNIS